MNETIEQMIMRILNQVSDLERSRNRSLSRRTARVLKALEYMKATVELKKVLGEKVGA